MSTSTTTMDHILEQVHLPGRLTSRKMFGEYALYLDGKVVAFVCDNTLYLKPCAATASLTASLPSGPPYPGAKPYPIGDELLDDPDRLRELLEEMVVHLPLPAKRTRTPRG